MPPTDCHHCGATIRNQAARFCEFCGTEHLRSEHATPGTPVQQRADRFARLKHHEDLSRLMELEPAIPPALPGLMLGFGAFFFVGLAVVSVVFAAFGFVMMPFGLVFLVPLALIWAGAIAFFRKLKRRVVDYNEAELVRRPAIVVARRTKVSGGGENSSASTTNFVTIEVEDGRRDEFRAPDEVAGVVTVGDAGVAYLKFDLLLDFQRVAV